jgi:hypothetical protein
MARLDTIRSKMLRRACLSVLRAAEAAGGDGWTAARAVFNFLRDDHCGLTLSETAEALRYLAAKGYAETRTQRPTKFDGGDLQARILPRGIDLLEETVPPDPGIEDNRV